MLVDRIKTIHLELSDKCQASCPMCPRNSFGGAEREHILNKEVTLEQIKNWFPPEFLQQLEHVFACGNNGDPLMAKECLEIFEYLVDNSGDNCLLSMNTNGSLRSKAWWVSMAKVLKQKGYVVFAIDGWQGEHELYRRGTNWQKIIDNAKAFIEAGGKARADVLVFEHNEARVDELEKFLYEIGFEHVNIKSTHRFYGFNQFPVKDKNGNFEYYLKPATQPRWSEGTPKVNFERLVDMREYNVMLKKAEIEPLCYNGYKIYINSQGHLYPCCWVGSCIDNDRYIEIQSKAEDVLRNRLADSAIDIVNDIGMIDLQERSIPDAIKASKWDSELPKHFTTDPKLICVKSCGKNFIDIVK